MSDSRYRLLWILVAVLVVSAGAVVATSHFVDTDGNIALSVTDGPEVIVQGDTELNLEDFHRDSPNILHVESSSGDVVFESDSSGPEVTIHHSDITGTWTKVDGLDVSDAELTIDPEDKDKVVVSGGVESLEWRDTIAADNGQVDFKYSGDGDETVLELRGVQEDTEIAAVDQSDELLDISTSDSTGVIEFELPNSEREVRLLTTEGSPELSNPEPTGSQEEEPDTLSIDVDDPDFVEGYNVVDVDIYFEGEQVHSESISNPDTVEADISDETILGGKNDWSVVATDSWGQQTIENYTFDSPDVLAIYDEENPDQLIDDVDVEIRFFEGGAEGEVHERETSDGTIDMEGLPSDKEFIVHANAEGYEDRRIYVDSLFESQEFFLIGEEEDTVETVFELEDFSGDFRKEHTVLEIRRHLDGEWRTVEGDYFGATGDFDTTLAENDRHELRLINVESGESRDLGSFTPTTPAVHTVTVEPDLSIELVLDDIVIQWSPSIERLTARENTTVEVDISRTQQTTLQEYEVTAELEDVDGTVEEVFHYSGTNPSGETIEAEMDLEGEENKTLNVIAQYTTEDGATGEVQKSYQLTPDLTDEYSLINWIPALQQQIPAENWSGFSTMAAMFATVIVTSSVASRYRLGSETVGMVALLTMGVFFSVGWVPRHIMFIGVAAFAAFAGMRRVA